MKKYYSLLVGSILVYLLLAIGDTYMYQQYSHTVSKAYEVDINRIEQTIQSSDDIKNIDVSLYPNVQVVTYLDLQEQDKNQIESFYVENNEYGVVYRPYIKDGIQIGMIKYEYLREAISLNSLFYTFQINLAILEGGILLILIYVRRRIVLPFQQLSSLPYELAQGHYKGSIKVEKNGYLKRFLWGMSQLKDTLDVSKKRQLDLEKEKKHMLLSISHDIKTPLNLIKLYGKAINDNIYDNTDANQKAAYQIGEKCVEIESYVNEIMKYSREDILDINVNISEFYLSDLMKKVLSVYEEPCALRHLDLHIGTYENRLLKGDIHRVQEVFENLFENAFKYGDGRQIEISFYEEDYCQLIRFHNSGEPIQAQECTHLFDSFYRGANAQGIQGNGLGLYICKTIMRKMKGDIFWEDSTQGMSFVLVFQ